MKGWTGLGEVLAGLGAVVIIGGVMWSGTAWMLERRMLRADPNTMPMEPKLMTFAVTAGQSVYDRNCRACHGPGGRSEPGQGVPALADGKWLYGSGKPAEIERTVTYGIRSHHPKAWNLASMPAYAQAHPSASLPLQPLTPATLDDIVAFLLSLRGGAADPSAAARGSALFRGTAGCYDCHAPDARGDAAVGAPALMGRAPLYGQADRDGFVGSVADGRAGICPAWSDRIPAVAIREVSLYVYALSTKVAAGSIR